MKPERRRLAYQKRRDEEEVATARQKANENWDEFMSDHFSSQAGCAACP